MNFTSGLSRARPEKGELARTVRGDSYPGFPGSRATIESPRRLTADEAIEVFQGPKHHGARFRHEVGERGRDELLAQLEQRGQKVVASLVEGAGPFLTLEQVAEVTGEQPKEILRRVGARKLLAVEEPFFTTVKFPEWQFLDSRPLEGLEQVLDALDSNDPTEVVLFLLARVPQLGKSPLDLLKSGRSGEAVRLAQRLGEHGGR